jgi:hypothetical protein
MFQSKILGIAQIQKFLEPFQGGGAVMGVGQAGHALARLIFGETAIEIQQG